MRYFFSYFWETDGEILNAIKSGHMYREHASVPLFRFWFPCNEIKKFVWNHIFYWNHTLHHVQLDELVSFILTAQILHWQVNWHQMREVYKAANTTLFSSLYTNKQINMMCHLTLFWEFSFDKCFSLIIFLCSK